MRLRAPAIVLAALIVANCSTIVEGTDQSVSVITEPTGARCELERKGTVVAIVNPTPGTAQVDKSKDNIAVECQKDGYQRTVAPLLSKFQGMTFGNILFGGLIGLAVDASSGAMNEYPPSITLHLPPEVFESPEERDRFYDDRIADVRADAAAARKAAENNCATSQGEAKDCTLRYQAIDAERERSIQALEAERAAARVKDVS